MADILGGVSGAASGAAAGAKLGSVLGLPGAAVGGVLGGLAGLFGSSSGSKKVPYQPLDISKIISDARTQAAENYANSFALERQYNPQTAALRSTANLGLSRLASGETPGMQTRNSLLDTLGLPQTGNPLLSESTERILGQLRLGGRLDPETQSAAVRGALQGSGAAGIAGSGAARGLVARDLGLTSLQLQQARQQSALSAGNILSQLGLQDYAARVAGLNAANSAAALDSSNILQTAGLIDARALPSSGLDPGSIASLYVSDNNARNQVAGYNAAIESQTRNANINAMLGLGGLFTGSGGLFGKPGAATTSTGSSLPSPNVFRGLFGKR